MSAMPRVRQKLFRTSRRLLDVLAVLEPSSAGLKWYCMELEPCASCSASGEIAGSCVVQEVCSDIRKLQSGVLLSWERAKTLARSLHPEDMLLFVATGPESPPPSGPLDLSSPLFEISIQSVEDGSLYVMTKNETVLARLRESFEDYAELFPDRALNPSPPA